MAERPAPILLERLRSVHRSLQAAGIDHAVGGALALAVHTRDPRFTSDIDLNVAADPSKPEHVFAALPDDVEIHPGADDEVRTDGQTRLYWRNPDTPLDLFLPVHPEYHALVTARAIPAQFLDDDIKVLSATDLMVFKTLFNRSKDWVDIESLIESDAGDIDEASRWVEEIVGNDGRVERLRRLYAEAKNPDASIDISTGDRAERPLLYRAKTTPGSTPTSFASLERGEGSL